MTSFQSSELTELPVVENSQLFAQRAHSARYAPPGGGGGWTRGGRCCGKGQGADLSSQAPTLLSMHCAGSVQTSCKPLSAAMGAQSGALGGESTGLLAMGGRLDCGDRRRSGSLAAVRNETAYTKTVMATPSSSSHCWRLIHYATAVDWGQDGSGREENCSAGGGGGDTEAHFPNPPPPSLAAVTGGGGSGRGCPTCRAGGRGGVNPTSMAQNDTHVALIILTTQMWGGGNDWWKKLFRAKICVPVPLAPTSVLTQNKGPDTEPHFSNTPPLPPSEGVHVTPARRAIFRLPSHGPWRKVMTTTAPTHCCKSNTKSPKFDGNTTSCCSDTGGACVRSEKTQAVTIAS